MTRPIEFRVWDITGKYHLNLDDYELFLNNNGLYERRTVNYMGDEYINVSEKYILEQFTGLLDKNGVKIFEGDVVEGDDGHIGIIEWDNDYGIWRNIYKKGKSVLCIDGKFALWQSFYSYKSTLKHDADIKVIGNIHQNPELLK